MDAPHPFIDSGHDWSKVCRCELAAIIVRGGVYSVQRALVHVQVTEATIDNAIQNVEEHLYSKDAFR
jgi:hypothetical protein